MKIKVCGLREKENIHEVAALGPDLLGFIFYPGSSRYAGGTLKPEDLSGLPVHPVKTGVFVNAGIDEVEGTFRRFNLDLVQLHGDETPSFCASLSHSGIPVIKVFRLDEGFEFRQTLPYIPFTKYFLFDARTEKYGGSGKRFNWKILDSYKERQPFFLSGGIGPGDAEEILSMDHPSLAGVDLNSRFEYEPGKKDTARLETFIKKLKRTEDR